MKLQGCPKCGGAVSAERDQYGLYVHCLICGWERDLTPRPPLLKTADHPSENVRAPDLGCSVSQSCFQCPLPDCKYDVPSARDAYLRDQALLAVFRQYQHLGTTAAAALTAEAVGTSDRSVYRALGRRQNSE
jgi:hypothetical protein